jgi:hypothetical protein
MGPAITSSGDVLRLPNEISVSIGFGTVKRLAITPPPDSGRTMPERRPGKSMEQA